MLLSQRRTRDVFTSGNLPVLLYANRQNAQDDKRDRPLHCHENLCELLICYHGSGVYVVDHASYEIQVGDIIYYNAGGRHEVRSSGETEIGTYCLGFTDVHLAGLPENHLVHPGDSFVRPAGQKEALLLGLADEIVNCPEKEPADLLRMQIMGAAFLMTACSIPSAHTRSLPTRSSEIAAAAKSFIDQHFTEPLQIADIAGAVNCSTSFLSHVFKEYTGYAPLQYIHRCRIGQAQTLLISSDYSVAYIASATGFESASYFNRVFRKIVGATPVAYREKYLAELRGSRKQL
ncbi:MAG: AraC family transcriptional regulator [Eubacteriales bacterium]|nr:AraC family transcriptional regulator [Eubacteriales bacterium]